MNSDGGVVFIKDVSEFVNRKVSLVGVVLEFSFPRKSLGTDYVSILRIVDESQGSPELSVRIFTKTIDQLPHVRSYGDLILVKNVKIKKFDEKVSAVFYKNSSSFALFDGTPSTNLIWYQSSPNFCLVDSEKDIISRVRQSCARLNFNSGSSDYLLSLKNISAKTYFDLVCKVLFVSYEASKDVWMLFVWDGSDAPPLNLHGKLQDEEQSPLPLHIESFSLGLDVLQRFHPIGTVLRVTADEAHENLGKHFTAVGKWVRIRNMTCQVSSGMWHGFLKSSSRMRLLSDSDDIVLDYRRKYNERIFGKCGRLPQWSNLASHLLTVIDGKDTTFVTLMDILTHAKVNFRYYSIVRVVAIHPSQAKNFNLPYGSSEYRMRLTLEDPTARIHALLCGQEWAKFFGSCPSADALTTKIKMLLGVPEHQSIEDGGDFLRNPPWIPCGLHLKKSDDRRNKLYYICCTRLAVR